MRGFFPATCLLILAIGLMASAQDASPKKGDALKVDGEAKTDQSKDAKGGEKKEDAKKKDSPKFGKFGKKGGKPVEDAPPPVPVTEPDLAPALSKNLIDSKVNGGAWR